MLSIKFIVYLVEGVRDTEAVGPVCMTHRAVCARRGRGVTHRQHGGFGDVVEKKLVVLNEQRCIGYWREGERERVA